MTVFYSTEQARFTDSEKIVMDKILQSLAVTGSGGGSGVVSNGAVDPVAAPANPTVTNWYANTATGTAWVWPAGGSAWQQIV